MKLLFVDIITDDPIFRESDEKMLSRYGGHKGLVHRGFGLNHELDDIVPGLLPENQLPDIATIISNGYDGVFVGGSTEDVDETAVIKPWQKWVFGLIRQLVKNKIPVLGVCGGHQYGVRALTEDVHSVIHNPLGKNFDTSLVSLTNDGLCHTLFASCGGSFMCQWSHCCVVTKIPNGSVRLAEHKMTHHAAIEYGSFIGLQWHPELASLEEDNYGVGVMRMIAETKKSGLIASGVISSAEGFGAFLQKNIQPAPCSKKILQNWLSMIASGYFRK